ncbi:hypothetical protein PPROV_000286800 [Pycnococcus provasolii]|uniref:WW domain-containing protein n=1 Tax=Pycnococcus provasolii TaxID=41880 RepID=A0A830HAI8_9CHLO|nr:hypothetical protein PPROV_000286800 [Pycnococcus provasolii]
MARTQNLHARPAIPAEVVRKAIELGIDYESPVTWRRYGWIAQEFYDARLPEPWSEYSDESSQIFYYDHSSGESRWEHPLLSTFRALLLKCEEEPQLLEYYQELYGSLRQYCDDRKGWWALNLLSTPNGGPPPTPEEVRDMAVYLGIDLTLEPDLLWIAKQAVQVALPPNWEELEDGTGAVYFYDVVNGKSTLKHPMDDYFFALAAEERRRLPERRKKTHGQPDIKSVWMPFLDDLGRAYYVHFGLGVVTYYVRVVASGPPSTILYAASVASPSRVVQANLATLLVESTVHDILHAKRRLAAHVRLVLLRWRVVESDDRGVIVHFRAEPGARH